MIVRSTGMIDASLVRSQNVMNFGYILFLSLRERNIDSATIEKLVRKWLVLSILTGRYSGSPESAFDYDIKRFTELNPIEFVENTESGQLSDASAYHCSDTQLSFCPFPMTQILSYLFHSCHTLSSFLPFSPAVLFYCFFFLLCRAGGGGRLHYNSFGGGCLYFLCIFFSCSFTVIN